MRNLSRNEFKHVHRLARIYNNIENISGHDLSIFMEQISNQTPEPKPIEYQLMIDVWFEFVLDCGLCDPIPLNDRLRFFRADKEFQKNRIYLAK